jgi:hypothetical protein
MSNAGVDNPGAVGGHNLRAGVPSVGTNGEIETGSVRITGKTVELNSADLDRAPSIIREAARGLQSGENPEMLQARLAELLKGAPPMPPRPPVRALGFREVTTPDRVPASARVLPIATNGMPVPPEVIAMMGDVSRPSRGISFVKQGEHIWVGGPGTSPPVLTSNLADASEFASLRVKASGGSGFGKGSPAEFQFANFSEGDRKTVMTNLRANAKRRGYSEDAVAVVSDERPGGFRRLSSADYDFENPTIRIEDPQIVHGQRVSKVTVELVAKRTGIGNAIFEFWVKVKGAISNLELSKIAQAIRLRVEQVFGRVAKGEIEGRDALVLLQEEMNRVGRAHNVEIETRVRAAAGNVLLAVVRLTIDDA